MKERYDKEEDRAKDVKRHDNSRHAGERSHNRRIAEAEVSLADAIGEQKYEQTKIEQG
jgi:hypothetical protein